MADKSLGEYNRIEHEHLELLVQRTDMLCDLAGLISPKSIQNLAKLGIFVGDHLEELYVPVTKVDYVDGVPITPAIKYPSIRAELEANLALMYTLQMHLPVIKGIKLKEERDECFRRSEQRFISLGNEVGKIKVKYYRGLASYLQAACHFVEKEINARTADQSSAKTEDVNSVLRESITLFEQVSQKAKGYHELYNVFSLFNLGRAYFSLGEKEQAGEMFHEALESPCGKRHILIQKLGNWHLQNIANSSLDYVLPDPDGFEVKTLETLKHIFVGLLGEGETAEFIVNYKLGNLIF